MKIIVLLLIVIVFLAGCNNKQLENITQEESARKGITETPVMFKSVGYTPNSIPINIPHKMTLEKIRWNSSILTFYSKIRENSTLKIIRDSIADWNKETVVKLVEVDDPSKANFIIRHPVVGELKERPGLTVVIGEAQLFTNYTGLFNLVSSAELLFTSSSTECESKATTIHELGHIVGFAHVTDAKSVMFPTVDCNGKITDEMKQTLINLYSIEPLPDLYFGDIKAEKSGKYVILNFTTWNRGLIKSSNASVEVKINEDTVKVYDIPSIQPSAGWVISDAFYTENEVDSLNLTIDPSNAQMEIDKENNVIILSPDSHSN